jgi:hypothetical protein
MKKIGILFGKERSFPDAFVARINSKSRAGITAEPVHISKAMQGEPVVMLLSLTAFRRMSHFYRTWLKNAALTGTVCYQ